MDKGPLVIAAIGLAGPYLAYRIGRRNLAQKDKTDVATSVSTDRQAISNMVMQLLTAANIEIKDLRLEADKSEESARQAKLQADLMAVENKQLQYQLDTCNKQLESQAGIKKWIDYESDLVQLQDENIKLREQLANTRPPENPL